MNEVAREDHLNPRHRCVHRGRIALHYRQWRTEGKTGVPIVDAGMRQMNTMGETVGLLLGSKMLNSDGLGSRLDA
jgi:deoxyribodipyrimidine photolyase